MPISPSIRRKPTTPVKDTTHTDDTSALQGLPLLDHPGLNKDTAFTQEERAKHGLVGLLPDAVEDLDRQFQRAMRQLAQKPSPIEEYIFLNGLYEYYETLFFKVATVAEPADLVAWTEAQVYKPAYKPIGHEALNQTR